MRVIYSEKQVANPGIQSSDFISSPSAQKPKQVADALSKGTFEIEFIDPQPLTTQDFKRCHDANYVDSILNLTKKNGFGTLSQSVVNSLPYTTGAQYTAAKLATPDQPTCALVSGFHHAGYDGWNELGWFCTFNGLMIAAAKLLAEDNFKKVCIIDCDMHWGNGTDNILEKLPELAKSVAHFSFGKYITHPSHAQTYLEYLLPNNIIYNLLKSTKPDVVIYQAGADVHVNDPYGGVLTTEEMFERDLQMFRLAKELNIPLTWNLAGGYQIAEDGSIDKIIELHLNTFRAAKIVYA